MKAFPFMHHGARFALSFFFFFCLCVPKYCSSGSQFSGGVLWNARQYRENRKAPLPPLLLNCVPQTLFRVLSRLSKYRRLALIGIVLQGVLSGFPFTQVAGRSKQPIDIPMSAEFTLENISRNQLQCLVVPQQRFLGFSVTNQHRKFVDFCSVDLIIHAGDHPVCKNSAFPQKYADSVEQFIFGSYIQIGNGIVRVSIWSSGFKIVCKKHPYTGWSFVCDWPVCQFSASNQEVKLHSPWPQTQFWQLVIH